MKLVRSEMEDKDECVSWMAKNLLMNDCSPRTLKGSTFYKIAGVLYLPVKPVLLLESLAPNPAVTGKRRLLALRRAMNDLQIIHPGVELCFLTKSDAKLAEAAKSYGFEEAKDYVLLRLLDAAQAKKRAKAGKAKLVEVRLPHDAGEGRRDEAPAERPVRHLPEAAGRESSVSGPQGWYNTRSWNPVQPLQPGDRPRT